METISLNDLLSMPDGKAWMADLVQKSSIVRVKNAIEPQFLHLCTEYCSSVTAHSLPNYFPLEEGAPNFYRVNFEDPRAYVKAFMHQVNFFEWNQDRLSLFRELGFLFDIRELSSHDPIDYSGTIKRISFQFYPAGRGYMNKHRDPIGKHQAGVLSVVLSKRSQDYETGGFFLENESGTRIFPEDQCNVGDLLIFNGQQTHGVELIDNFAPYEPLANMGRWMALVAVTKNTDNSEIPDAQDLGGI
ncbi:MAG: hypothetical protein P8L66_07975 [Rhodospirillaceae bacterium]|nr:hypothetical protein [Rhodospirillaceae bacterium]